MLRKTSLRNSSLKKYSGVLILGATSDIAQELCRLFAQSSERLYLSARLPQNLQPLKKDIETTSSCQIGIFALDACQYNTHAPALKEILPFVEVVVCIFGYLGDTKQAEQDFEHCRYIIETNYLGAVSLLNIVANAFESKKQGSIVGISSVAALRGRQSNYIYGSAKAGFSTYLSGLRNRLWPSGVHVMTVLPGPVRTKMTSNRKRHPLLSTSPKRAARWIYRACRFKKDILYLSPLWRWIMLIVNLIPEALFKRLRV